MNSTETLLTAEERLQFAQLNSDIDLLDALLHPDLIFVAPDGTLGNKKSDMKAHRSGLLRLKALEAEDLAVRICEGVGLTILTAKLSGHFAEREFSNRMIYTRTWASCEEGWRVVGAHISIVE